MCPKRKWKNDFLKSWFFFWWNSGVYFFIQNGICLRNWTISRNFSPPKFRPRQQNFFLSKIVTVFGPMPYSRFFWTLENILIEYGRGHEFWISVNFWYRPPPSSHHFRLFFTVFPRIFQNNVAERWWKSSSTTTNLFKIHQNPVYTSVCKHAPLRFLFFHTPDVLRLHPKIRRLVVSKV